MVGENPSGWGWAPLFNGIVWVAVPAVFSGLGSWHGSTHVITEAFS